MLLAVWIALGVFVVAVAGSLGFAVSRGLATWRAFGRLRREVVDAQFDLMRRVLAVERRLDGAGESAARLQRAQAQLHDSLATARALAAAYADVRATVGRVTGLVPRK